MTLETDFLPNVLRPQADYFANASLGGELGVKSLPGIGSAFLFSTRFEPRHSH